MTRVTVLVRQDAAPAVQRRTAAGGDSRELLRTADELGVALEPMHPGVNDPVLQGYFCVDVADSRQAQHVIDRLGACKAVEAAYVKPPEAAP
jgi:hypothetical protein